MLHPGAHGALAPDFNNSKRLLVEAEGKDEQLDLSIHSVNPRQWGKPALCWNMYKLTSTDEHAGKILQPEHSPLIWRLIF